MGLFSEMDWNPRWDWENFTGFGSKATESPKKPQPLDRLFSDDGELNGGSFNLSSDGGYVSSAKSSLSASTDSQCFKLMTSEGSSGNFSSEISISRASPLLKSSSIDYAEPLIGLKLGKRTYFENNGAGESFSVMPTPSIFSPSSKRTKSSGRNLPIPRCVVEGCDVDLTVAKEYHRKHRICDGHSKCPKVIVGGLERRFCQQCSKLHGLSEFDERKRSCRRRLSDHNARRRKPQLETVLYTSARPSPPFYGERQKLNFLLNSSPFVHSKNSTDATWDDSSYDSKFALTKEYPLKSTSGDRQMHMRGTNHAPPHVINMHGLFASKSNMPQVINPAPEYGRALSLLSKNAWYPCGPENMPTHENGLSPQHMTMHNTIPEGVPLASSDFWMAASGGHQSRLQSFVSNSNYQEIQLLAAPYEAELYYV